jgi:hypothetical protein
MEKASLSSSLISVCSRMISKENSDGSYGSDHSTVSTASLHRPSMPMEE